MRHLYTIFCWLIRDFPLTQIGEKNYIISESVTFQLQPYIQLDSCSNGQDNPNR